MLQYEKIDVSEGIDINKSNKSRECMTCHLWYFKHIGYKFELHVCNKCHHISMVAYELESIAMLSVKGVDYRCILWNMTKTDAIIRLNNSKLNDKGTLLIWILVQIKHLLK